MENHSVSDDELHPDEPLGSELETEETIAQSSEKDFQDGTVEKGEGSDVVFAREGPLIVIGKDQASTQPSKCSGCNIKKLKCRGTDDHLLEKGNLGKEKKLNRHDRIELGRLFQSAISSQDWEISERLIQLADLQTLNDLLCISLDSIWFLRTEHELRGITGLISQIVCHGAHDYTRATLRTSFLASCVSSCQSRTLSLADTVTVMAQRYTSDSLINFWFA
uniref:Ankyrin repeat protein SKIP35 n=1 Tax=Noccaea caerulescens TaxID=107243 RepID=A0A1J3GKY7_NOCCA